MRKPPARYTGSAEAHAADNIEFYRPQFFAFIDNITTELLGYFSGEGLKTYSKLESILFRTSEFYRPVVHRPRLREPSIGLLCSDVFQGSKNRFLKFNPAGFIGFFI